MVKICYIKEKQKREVIFMCKILTHPDNIKKIVTKNNLSHIVIETGKDNVFIKGENKFIVTKDFLANFPFLFFLF